MNHMLDWVLQAIASIGVVPRLLIVGIAIMLETSAFVGLVIPGDTVVLTASTAITGIPDYLATIVVVVIGALFGESLGFTLGRWFGPRIEHSWLGHKLGVENWERARRYIDRRGGPAIFMSRFLPVFHSLVPLTVGMSTMRYRRFITWTAPACLIWAGSYVSIAWFAASRYKELSKELSWAIYLFFGVIVIFVIVVWFIKKQLLKSEKKHMTTESEST